MGGPCVHCCVGCLHNLLWEGLLHNVTDGTFALKRKVPTYFARVLGELGTAFGGAVVFKISASVTLCCMREHVVIRTVNASYPKINVGESDDANWFSMLRKATERV